MITFPRDIPGALRFMEITFDLLPNQKLAPERGGRVVAVDMGPALWTASFQSRILTEAEIGLARAWYDTLISSREFYAYDMLREYPYAYRNTHWTGLTVGGSPFEGTCQLVNVESNNVEIDLEQLPDGFVLTEGDYLAFDYGADAEYRALHRVVSSATANISGAMTVEVRPHVRSGWQAVSPAVSRTVHLYRPAARMVIEPDSWQAPTIRGRRGRVSFRAIQTR